MKTTYPILAVLVAFLLVFLAAAVQAQPADRALQLDAELEQGIEQAVAYVAVEYQKPNSTRRYIESGTGFFVTASHLITNHHVIAPALTSRDAHIKVRLYSGTREARTLTAEVLKSDPAVDLAMLLVQGDLPVIAPVRIDPRLPGKQTEVFAFGFPLGTMLDRSLNGPNVCLRRGYVSRLINDGKSIEADLNIDKGISGGPLVDEEGVVRGVVRAMAGSEYNRNFAAISVAAPVLLEFCRNGGLAVTLKDGATEQPVEQAVTQAERITDLAPQARTGFGEDVMRAFFSIGSSLRLASLVPGMLALDSADYTPDLKQTSQHNADLVLTNLQRVNAPAKLVQQARELSVLLSNAQTQPSAAKQQSAGLERECDQWTKHATDEEKLNYDLGAWLTELSLGLIKIENDVDNRTCAYFLEAAGRADATPEIMQTLTRLQTNLNSYRQAASPQLRRAISKDADQLIAIGYLATVSTRANIGEKLSPLSPDVLTPRNQIHYPL